MSVRLTAEANLAGLYNRLLQAYGRQAWWPAEGRFEILAGAILTQNTAWTNVDRAIQNLRDEDLLEAANILGTDNDRLTELLRPAGTFRIKAQRLYNLCRWFVNEGGFSILDKQSTSTLRQQLLSINGIGPETADAILLYAFSRPVFVIDAYTRRLLKRLGWLKSEADYESLRAVFELTLDTDVDQFAQYHALIVEHAKLFCRARPQCAGCILKRMCAMGMGSATQENTILENT